MAMSVKMSLLSLQPCTFFSFSLFFLLQTSINARTLYQLANEAQQISLIAAPETGAEYQLRDHEGDAINWGSSEGESCDFHISNETSTLKKASIEGTDFKLSSQAQNQAPLPPLSFQVSFDNETENSLFHGSKLENFEDKILNFWGLLEEQAAQSLQAGMQALTGTSNEAPPEEDSSFKDTLQKEMLKLLNFFFFSSQKFQKFHTLASTFCGKEGYTVENTFEERSFHYSKQSPVRFSIEGNLPIKCTQAPTAQDTIQDDPFDVSHILTKSQAITVTLSFNFDPSKASEDPFLLIPYVDLF